MALLPGGAYAQYAKVNKKCLMEAPKLPGASSSPETEAAAIPEVWLTAFQLLKLVL